MQNEQHELLPLSEASRRLGVCLTTLRTWVREGRVPSYRVGKRFIRINWHELLAAIAGKNAERGE
ncbi:MAG: helix-turn-helix domain-containing protein [Planctomycetes bacterium]|nr:helix-turn-helix domain-containing protein [Planctomycetota bacterium]